MPKHLESAAVSEHRARPRRTKQLFQAISALLGISTVIVPLVFHFKISSSLHENEPQSILGPQKVVIKPLISQREEEGRANQLPPSKTPALMGAKRGHIKCDVNVDSLAYWNDPQGARDVNFTSPFILPQITTSNAKYVSFELDRGGWNNIRMSLENMIVFAAATGRILVLPPDHPLYLLKLDQGKVQRNVGDFFSLDLLRNKISIITTEEFVKREGGPDGNVPIPEHHKAGVMATMKSCEYRAKSKISCFKTYDYFREEGFVPNLEGDTHCLIFDERKMNGKSLDARTDNRIQRFCGRRSPVYFDQNMRDLPLIHFRTSEKDFRILNHFYSFIFFTNPVIDNYFKRLIRDFVHYKDLIFCAAGKIVRALQEEARDRGFDADEFGAGGYSSLHVRRGDFQWKDQWISGTEWYENNKDLWRPNEILYIATDEKNMTFFKPLADHFDLRFFSDFSDVAKFAELDPNYIGMIEAIVASRGRIFVGTYFSSFTAYIGRMRGYQGISHRNMWYAHKKHRRATHTWVDPRPSFSAREFPVGWVGIDGDQEVSGFL